MNTLASDPMHPTFPIMGETGINVGQRVISLSLHLLTWRLVHEEGILVIKIWHVLKLLWTSDSL